MAKCKITDLKPPFDLANVLAQKAINKFFVVLKNKLDSFLSRTNYTVSYYTLFEMPPMAAGLWGLGSAILYFAEAKYKIADPKRPFPLAKHSGASENVKVYSSLITQY